MAHLLIQNTVISDRRLPLPGKVVVLGRSLDVDVPIPHLSVSRRHALVELSESGWRISDLGSVNGTFVDERKLEGGERAPIGIGMPFRLGDVVFRIAADEVLAGEPEAAWAVVPAVPSVAPAVAPPVTAPPASALQPVKVPELTASHRALDSVPKPKSDMRSRPSAKKRANLRKQKRDAMRWVGVLVTVVLITLAAVFIGKIANMTGNEETSAQAAEDEGGGAAEAEKDVPRGPTPTPRELESLLGND
jgi:predicted component of type VI protein secretion system